MSQHKHKKSTTESRKPRSRKGKRERSPAAKPSGTPRTRDDFLSPEARKIADEAIRDGEARVRRIEAKEQGINPDTVAADSNLKYLKKKPGRSKGKRGKADDGKSDGATSNQTPKPPRASLLNAAATVLAESTTPMRVGEILAEITKRSLWSSPKGKTPGATLNAAMIREIAARGEQARFKRHDRGLFVAASPVAKEKR